MTTNTSVDLATILGRVVASLRKETGKSQTGLASDLGWDRSLLSRIESGRNTANIDNIWELEEVFINAHLIEWHGDLTKLTGHAVREAKRRGLRTVHGQLAKEAGEVAGATAALDRIVAHVTDNWLVELRG